MRIILTLLIICSTAISYSQGIRIKPDKMDKRKINSQAQSELKKGLIAYKSNDVVLAKLHFRKSIEIDSTYTEAHLSLARVLEQQDSTSSASESYNNAVSSNNVAPRAYFDRGKFNIRQKKYSAASRDLKAANALYNKNVSYNYYYGIALYQTNDYEGALTQFNKVIKKNEKHNYAYNDRGATQLKLNDLDAAQSDFNKSIAINKDFYLTYINRGKLALLKGEYDNAIKEFNTALEKEQNHLAAINGLGVAQMQKGQYEVAQSHFNKAIELNPKIAVSYINRSSLFIKRNDYKNAIKDCDMAIQLDKNANKAYYNRGIAKEMIRDEEGACSDWEVAFSLGSVEAEKYLNSAVCNQ
jgi:tetratricopeptide (TPR) repeat protein